MSTEDFERMLERLMKEDMPAGNESFREELLERCLAVLSADDEGSPVDDDELDFLAAAGDLTAAPSDRQEPTRHNQ